MPAWLSEFIVIYWYETRNPSNYSAAFVIVISSVWERRRLNSTAYPVTIGEDYNVTLIQCVSILPLFPVREPYDETDCQNVKSRWRTSTPQVALCCAIPKDWDGFYWNSVIARLKLAVQIQGKKIENSFHGTWMMRIAATAELYPVFPSDGSWMWLFECSPDSDSVE